MREPWRGQHGSARSISTQIGSEWLSRTFPEAWSHFTRSNVTFQSILWQPDSHSIGAPIAPTVAGHEGDSTGPARIGFGSIERPAFAVGPQRLALGGKRYDASQQI